uniref:Uncharacterized protein n=1 Tax=Thelephora ganbajun TaxID=370292 RepID=A0A343B742_THEGA|nr:hypothetical protein [Thelephora ganbajun]
MGYNKVEKWRNNLDSVQSVSLNDSESPLTKLVFGSDSDFQSLVGPEDSASQITEIVSEPVSNLQVPSEVAEFNPIYGYDIIDQNLLFELVKDPTVVINTFNNHFYLVKEGLTLFIDPAIMLMC